MDVKEFLQYFVEPGLISKRFLLAMVIIAYFAYTGSGEGIAGTVIGYYFGTHTTTEPKEAA
jgi:hypothetical protein